MTGISIKYELNSNTIIMLFGFIGTIVTGVFLWSDSQHLLADNTKRLDDHDTLFAQMVVRLDAVDKRDADMRDLTFRVGAIEKGQDASDQRMNRMSESYGNKFTEIGTFMSSTNTQLALILQSQQRIEGLAKTPGELR